MDITPSPDVAPDPSFRSGTDPLICNMGFRTQWERVAHETSAGRQTQLLMERNEELVKLLVGKESKEINLGRGWGE